MEIADNEIEKRFMQQFIVKNKRDKLLFELSEKATSWHKDGFVIMPMIYC